MKKPNRKDPAHVGYLTEKILDVCNDERSTRYYRQVAEAMPDEVIFQMLSEIKQDASIRNRGAVFVCKVKQHLQRHRRTSRPQPSEGYGH